ncbi:hypothetical protein EYF80_029718 [Liparis tanakae]|uniref:Uncharacterized protein n=1 Tax=Liparis tanakae TaxID=230148 RepID=A0A4Z2H2Q1_9TELE|nr:hypothetical protein EYF80_029718 [Liparis tanakae]
MAVRGIITENGGLARSVGLCWRRHWELANGAESKTVAIKTSLREGQCPLRVTRGTGHLIGSLSDEHCKAGVALDSQSAQFLTRTHQQLWMGVQQRDRWEEVVVVVVVEVSVSPTILSGWRPAPLKSPPATL